MHLGCSQPGVHCVTCVERLGWRHRRWIVGYNQGVHQVCIEGEGFQLMVFARDSYSDRPFIPTDGCCSDTPIFVQISHSDSVLLSSPLYWLQERHAAMSIQESVCESVQKYRILLVPGLAQGWYGKLSTNIPALRDARDLGARVKQSSLPVSISLASATDCPCLSTLVDEELTVLRNLW